MPKRTGEPPHHNNLTCYTDYGCRLPECVERRRLWQRESRRKHREGQPVFVDATPVRRHLIRLHSAGISTYRVAHEAGVDDWTVRAFMPSSEGRRARKHRTTPEIAAKILAVTIEAATTAYVDGTGTRRRIQALAANGWPLRRLSEHLGLNDTYIRDLVSGRQKDRPVFAATAEKVAHGYERMKNRKPTRYGIEPCHAASARQRAKDNRWPPPKYWVGRMDVIDDPHFEPMYGRTRGELLAADARELFTYGITTEQAAERLGVTKAHLYQELLRHPEETTPQQDDMEAAA